MTFLGYERPDGRVGVRNHVLILPASVCASDTARIVASQVEGAVAYANQSGCAQIIKDAQITMDVMAGLAANPNVHSVVVLALGCETCQMGWLQEEIKKRTNKPMVGFIIQENGGTLNTIAVAVRAAKQFVQQASMQQRREVSITELIVGTECGGSDPTSGFAANPVIGAMSDRLVDMGATSILSETTEFIGAEHLLAKRGKTKEIHDRIFEIVHRYEDHLALFGEEVRAGNPSPGNKAGGLTTLEEKSLGCIHKGGYREISAVFEYAQIVDQKGLVIMDTPGYDAASVNGMVAGGCQVVVFSTGRGTPTGHPIAPVIKITGNKITFQNMEDNIDINASAIVYGEATIDDIADVLMDEVVQVSNGKITKAEALGFVETATARLCNHV